MRETLLAMKPSIMRRHLVSASSDRGESTGGRVQRGKEGSVERASLRETQDTGCKGGPRQGVRVVVKPYREYRRSISFLAL